MVRASRPSTSTPPPTLPLFTEDTAIMLVGQFLAAHLPCRFNALPFDEIFNIFEVVSASTERTILRELGDALRSLRSLRAFSSVAKPRLIFARLQA